MGRLQISANLLRDEELLTDRSGGRQMDLHWNGIDRSGQPCDRKKGFNKPGEYGVVLNRLAQRNAFAIYLLIFGMDNDTPGVAKRTLKEIRSWPPGLPIFGLMTPLPATPLHKKAAGRLTRPKHWQEFIPFAMAHTPLRMSIDEAHNEVRKGWISSYNPDAIERAVDSLEPQAAGLSHQHPYRTPLLPGEFIFRRLMPLRMV